MTTDGGSVRPSLEELSPGALESLFDEVRAEIRRRGLRATDALVAELGQIRDVVCEGFTPALKALPKQVTDSNVAEWLMLEFTERHAELLKEGK